MTETHKVILARHSETVWNEQLRYIGRTDMGLSALGERHAQMLARFLEADPIHRIYSSDMLRSMETAGAVAADRDVEIIVEHDLREIDFGEWEGLTFDEIASAYPDLADIWVEDPFAVRIPGGEPIDEFSARVRRAWKRIRPQLVAAAPADGATLVVTHAGCIKVILGEILGLEERKVWEIHQEKGALNHIELTAQGDRVLEINDRRYREQAE